MILSIPRFGTIFFAYYRGAKQDNSFESESGRVALGIDHLDKEAHDVDPGCTSKLCLSIPFGLKYKSSFHEFHAIFLVIMEPASGIPHQQQHNLNQKRKRRDEKISSNG